MEEDKPNGPNPGMGLNRQHACHVAHIGNDTGEAEINQLSRFQHLEKMVKLTAMHVGLRQDSDPICSDADDGSDPDWSLEDDQDHYNVAGDAPEPPHPQKRRKTDDPLCSERDNHVADRDGIFFRPPDTKVDMFDVDDYVAEYVSNYLYSTISDDSLKQLRRVLKNLNFFEAPVLNSSVANSLKSSKNKSLMNGDKFLSTAQSFLTAAAFGRISMKKRIKLQLVSFYTVCNNPSFS